MTELTIGAATPPPTATGDTADCVKIGTSSPTCSTAFLFSTTINVGDDTTLTSVIVLKAFRTALMLKELKK